MTTPDYHLEPEEAPDWAFSPDTGITCPECDALLSGLNWKMSQPKIVNSTPSEVTAEATMTAMILVPCGHELPTDIWELTFSGRDRRLGTVIRTPKFQRKDGS
jgi:hypothetical protein